MKLRDLIESELDGLRKGIENINADTGINVLSTSMRKNILQMRKHDINMLERLLRDSDPDFYHTKNEHCTYICDSTGLQYISFPGQTECQICEAVLHWHTEPKAGSI